MQPKLYLFPGCSEILEYSITRETWGTGSVAPSHTNFSVGLTLLQRVG